MADSFNKKEREKKRKKKQKDKAEKREQRKLEGKSEVEFMYVDEFGNLTPEKPDPAKRMVINAEDINISTPKGNGGGGNNFTREGIVKFFNTEKGYGFITDRLSGDSFFVHIDGLIDKIKDNDKVSFEVGKGPKGPVANQVKLI